ncbi:MAG: imidazole glycerol phosphate synthase subunit HisH, partial [candidate division Zixibacteria bacterium]|nr:imidazole glycerol phosphate synthase subunit HisH [candidate division Zixibacteria bacterium]
MNRVVIVDYGMCNLDSIARAIEECGGRSFVTDDPRELKEATQVILPGVGAFADAMQNLRERDLVTALQDQVIGNHIPFL